MTTLTTLAITTRGTTLDHLQTTTPLAPPVRVAATELAGSVVLLAPGRSLLVSDDTGARWRAVVNDSSVAAVLTGAEARAGVVGTDVACYLGAAAAGRTRGCLIDASGQRHPFEVIVMAPAAPTGAAVQSGDRTCGQIARRAAWSSPRSWAARLRRALLPAGPAVAGVAVNG